MTSLASHRASLVLLLGLVPTPACVQTTDFQETDEESGTGPGPSTSALDTEGSEESDGTGGPGQTSGGDPQDPGDSLWVWLSERNEILRGLGLGPAGDVLAAGGVIGEFQTLTSGVLWSSTPPGDVITERIDVLLEGAPLWDLCVRPDGGVFAVGMTPGFSLDGLDTILYVFDVDPSGEITRHPYAGMLAEDYQSSAVLPRVICDLDGQAWVAMSYDSTASEAGMTVTKTLAAQFDTSGFTGWERVFEEGGGTFEGLIGAGGDAEGGLHLSVIVETPGGEGYELLWHRFDAAGDSRSDLVLGSESFFGGTPQVLHFTASGQRAAIVGYDSMTDRNWIVVTDPDGNEQWRSDQLPAPSELWNPRAVAIADDGGVVIAAWSGQQHDQILSLVTFEPGGALAWSRSYADFGDQEDPTLAPEHMDIGGVQMNADTIDVAGSVWRDASGDQVSGWVRRVLR